MLIVFCNWQFCDGTRMFYLLTALTIMWANTGLANISIRRAGWLDRMVEYQKNKFFEDLKKLPVVQIKAKIERAPIGYTDSRDWDYESVVRLITLIRDSDGAEPVRQVLRRSMQSSRRFMSFVQSFKMFPSLAKDHANNFYYDVDAGEYYADTNNAGPYGLDDNDKIIVVSNPVEARLPSASISVRLLKSILENRAKSGRFMTTTKKKIPWSRTTKKSGESSADTPKDDNSKTQDSQATTLVPENAPDVTNQPEDKTTV